jgi:hypothetical protein
MVAIAIFSTDSAMCRSLEQLLREDLALSIVGVAGDPAAISLLIEQNHVNVVLADAPPCEQCWRLLSSAGGICARASSAAGH